MERIFTRFRFATYFATAFIGMTLSGTPVVAQTPARPPLGSITATAYSETSPGAQISIQFAQDLELNERLLSALQEVLQEQGYRVSPGAPLVLNVSLDIETDAQAQRRIELSGEGDKRGLSDAKVTVQLGKNKDQPKRTHYRLGIDLIDDKTRAVWKGVATASADTSRERGEVAETMIRSLIADLGTTVRRKTLIE